MLSKTIHEIAIGDTAYFEKTISETDIYLFSGISGDYNAAHLNAVEAEKSVFKKRVAHGLLVAGLVSAVLGTQLPGKGTIYLGQDLKFVAPVFIGDTICATVTATEIKAEKNICIFDTVCTNQHGEQVITGKATVMPPKVAS